MFEVKKIPKIKSVFFIMPNLGGGGGERIVSILLNNIDRTKFEPHLVILKEYGSNTFVLDLKDDVIIHSLGIKKRIKRSFPLLIYKLIKLCKREKPDILFFGSGQINALIAPFLFLFPKHIKKIARESNIPSIFEKHLPIKLCYRYFYSKYDKIIVQSDDMFNDLHQNFKIPRSRMVKINNPVDVLYVDKKLRAYKDVKLSNNKINLLAVGRLTYQKGFDNLLIELAKLKVVDYHLTILGDGEERLNLEKFVSENNLVQNVVFEGNVDNPYKYMEKADALILSSRFEGFPNVLLESLVCGTPVLANYCVGGIGEIVIQGFNGYIYSFADGDFESKLKLLRESNISKNAIKKDAIYRFSVENKISEFESQF